MATELAPTKDVLMPKMDPCDRCSCDGCFSSHLVGILYSQGLPVVLTQNSWSACPKQIVIYWSQSRSASGGKPSNFSALAFWWFYNPVTPLRLLNRLCFKNFLRRSFLILELKMLLPRHQKVQGLPFFTAKTKNILDWRDLLDLVFEIESARPLTWKDVLGNKGWRYYSE